MATAALADQHPSYLWGFHLPAYDISRIASFFSGWQDRAPLVRLGVYSTCLCFIGAQLFRALHNRAHHVTGVAAAKIGSMTPTQ